MNDSKIDNKRGRQLVDIPDKRQRQTEKHRQACLVGGVSSKISLGIG